MFEDLIMIIIKSILMFCGLLVTVVDLSAATFELESVPFERAPHFRVKTDVLVLREMPSTKSPAVRRVPIKKGSIVTFSFMIKELLRWESDEVKGSINTEIMLDKSIQRTVKPGIIKVIADGSFHGERIGRNNKITKSDSRYPKTEEFFFKKGDTFEYLLYLGEGVCLVRYHDDLITHHGCIFTDSGSDQWFVQISEPVIEWWLRFNKKGKALGWIKMKMKAHNYGGNDKDIPLELLG